MIKYHRQLIKLISEQVKKYKLLHSAKGIVENATEKAQSKLSNAQNVATEKYNIVAKKLNDQVVIMQDLNAKALEPNAPLPGKIIKWWQWYNQLIGMDTVEASRRQVIALQDKLFKCHDNRITLNKEFINITYKLQDLYAELLLTKREDPKFLQLTTEEHRSLQEKQKFLNQIELLEKEERDSFTQLATALKDYQVNQNLNAQKYKSLDTWAVFRWLEVFLK